ncbi:hypothetical protein J8Z28_07765 [Pseudoalteromonas sp. SCSIO 43088]|uniref:hypothetical protein n=1 Tax=Pseudoalteromonas sp. SCSIO 43088 TaxID=2822846 RepID=UPI00202B8961|nr:hypothetical protein [Pseudoalteromonas sp. SCSIO 43088]URQ87728.1 hypothetical protein J8Z28_07765 [Pseudoalteromonas sp. SCSIO 43088]
MDNLDDILENGTPEEIEAALAEVDIDGDTLFGGEDGSEKSEPVVDTKEAPAAEAEAEQDESKAQAETDVKPESSTEASEQKGDAPEGYVEIDGKYYVEATDVKSKNGQHSLPYDVLAQARKRAADAEAERQRLADEKAELESKYEETKQLAELHSSQLKDAGIDARKLPKQMLEDPELMERIKEEYPELGEMVSALAEQVRSHNASQQQAQVTANAGNELTTAFESSQHLKSWRDSDADKWEMAQVIDEKLANDPSFKNKSVAERFAEVEKRVQSAFGEQYKPKPSGVPTAAIPNSPTDLGSQASDLSANAGLLDKDAATMTDEMSNMTEAQIADLLSEASEFLY